MDRRAETGMITFLRCAAIAVACMSLNTFAATVNGSVDVTSPAAIVVTGTTKFYPGHKLVIRAKGAVDINHLSWTSEECGFLGIGCHDVPHESSNIRTPAQNPVTLELLNRSNLPPFVDTSNRRTPSEFVVGGDAVTIDIGTKDANEFTTAYELRGYVAGPLKRQQPNFGIGLGGMTMQEIVEGISRAQCKNGASPCSIGAFTIEVTIDTSHRVQMLEAFLQQKRTMDVLISPDVLDALTRQDDANHKRIAELILSHANEYYKLAEHSQERLRLLELAAQYDTANPEIANHITAYHIEIGNYGVAKIAGQEGLAKSQKELDTVLNAGGTPTPAQYAAVATSHGNLARVYDGESALPDELHLEAAAAGYLRAAENMATAADLETNPAKQLEYREAVAAWYLRRAHAYRRTHTREALERAAVAADAARAAIPRLIPGEVLSISGDERFLLAAKHLTDIGSPTVATRVGFISLADVAKDGWTVAAVAGTRLLLVREHEVAMLDPAAKTPPVAIKLDAKLKSAATGASGAMLLLENGTILRLAGNDPSAAVDTAGVTATCVAHAATAPVVAWAADDQPIRVIQADQSIVSITPSSAAQWSVRTLSLSPDASSVVALLAIEGEDEKQLEWRVWSVADPTQSTTIKAPPQPAQITWLDNGVIVLAREKLVAYEVRSGAEKWQADGRRAFSIGGNRVVTIPVSGAISTVTMLNMAGKATPIPLAVEIDAAAVSVLAAATPEGTAPFTIASPSDIAELRLHELPSGKLLSAVATTEIEPMSSGVLTGGRWTYSFNRMASKVTLRDRDQLLKSVLYEATTASDARPTVIVVDIGKPDTWLTLQRAKNGVVQSVDWRTVDGIAHSEKLPGSGWTLVDSQTSVPAGSLAFVQAVQKGAASAKVPLLLIDTAQKKVTRKELAGASFLVAMASPNAYVYRDGSALRLKRGDSDSELLPDGAEKARTVISASGARVLVATGASSSPHLRVFDAATGVERPCDSCLEYAPGTLTGVPVASSPAITRLAFATSRAVAVADMETNKVLARVPFGEPVAVGAEFVLISRNGVTELWRIPAK